MSKFFETFTPQSEQLKAEEERRTYDIKPLSKMQFWEFLGSADQKGQAAVQVELKVLEQGLRNWTNLKAGNGELVQFDGKRETIIEHMPVIHARAIVKRIVELSVLSDSEIKNS